MLGDRLRHWPNIKPTMMQFQVGDKYKFAKFKQEYYQFYQLNITSVLLGLNIFKIEFKMNIHIFTKCCKSVHGHILQKFPTLKKYD